MDGHRPAPDRPSPAPETARGPRRGHRWPVLLLVGLISLIGLAGCSDSSTTSGVDFPGLTAGQRVYDQTGRSLDASQTAELQRRLEALRGGTGADVIVYVRELDADSDDTLDQVEALQQAWVAATGTDQRTAGAILINREPGTDDEARAGIFVGTTYDDGNVPSDEQKAIIEDALIPPLRDGNVAGSLEAGVDRLGSSIRNGPPIDALDRFAAGPGSTWLPWTGGALALVGLFGVALLSRGRARPTAQQPLPTTARPDHHTEPAVAAALLCGTAGTDAVPATVLALAERGALEIEQDPETRKKDKDEGAIRIRLLDRGRAPGEVGQTVWGLLAERAAGDLVDSKALAEVAASGAIKSTLEQRLRADGWLADGTRRPRTALAGLAVLGMVLLIGGIVVAAAGAPLMLLTVIPAALLLGLGIIAVVVYSRLSVEGLDAALPWKAYRDGLKASARNERAELDLDALLPDIMALGLETTFRKQLEAATDPNGATTLRAFSSTTGQSDSAAFPWVVFSGSFGASGGGGGTVSGGGSGGGGGAAGST